MYLIHLLVLGFLAATRSLNGGVAAFPSNMTTRSTDITCGGQYPKAGDGFAKRPDGCSSWSENELQVADKFGSANFGGVCDDHDRCYYTIGANVDYCNDDFCSGLRNACHNAYCTPILGCITAGPCMAIAETYCLAVKAVAAGVYHKAQDLQKGYETCIADSGGIAPPPPPVLCSNGQPEGATWSERLDGSRCTTTYFVCRNGQAIVTQSYHAPHCIEP